MQSPHRLLIVGAGLTGSVSASLLRRKFPKEALNITVWEKSRGAGGRMTTNRDPSDSRCSADLGAQYVSATSAYAKSHERYINLCNVCLPFCFGLRSVHLLLNFELSVISIPRGVGSVITLASLRGVGWGRWPLMPVFNSDGVGFVITSAVL